MTNNKIQRKFSSYGPVDTDLHFYVAREKLVNEILVKLVGTASNKNGNILTIWAPHQSGKTWVFLKILSTLCNNPKYKMFDAVYVPVETLKLETNVNFVIKVIIDKILEALKIDAKTAHNLNEFEQIFTTKVLTKPLILILDEFDTLIPEAIAKIVGVFRSIYISQQGQHYKPTNKQIYLLHSVALIGKLPVLGMEGENNIPFNVQQSVHIPNLTFGEVQKMYRWYEKESEQQVEQAVIDRVFYETNGQPGLVSWLGELLTVKYNRHNPSITLHDFEIAYSAAMKSLTNANVINIINQANQTPYKQLVLELFESQDKLLFRYEDPVINFLYINGIIDKEASDEVGQFIRFASPFIQKKLFNHFSGELFDYVGDLYNPLDNLDDVFTDQGLDIPSLLRNVN